MINDNLARDILMSHADTLAAGHDVTATLAARYPDLAPLLWLARDVEGALEQVAVSAEFVRSLRASLLLTPTNSVAEQPDPVSAERPNWQVGGAVALGSAITGLAVYAVRRFIAGPKADNGQATPVAIP